MQYATLYGRFCTPALTDQRPCEIYMYSEIWTEYYVKVFICKKRSSHCQQVLNKVPLTESKLFSFCWPIFFCHVVCTLEYLTYFQHNIQQLNATDLPEGLQVAVSAVSLPQMSDTSPQYAELKTENSSSHHEQTQ